MNEIRKKKHVRRKKREVRKVLEKEGKRMI